MIAAKLAVAAGFCTEKQVQDCVEAQETLSQGGTSLALPHVLLKKGLITAMQYRLLNMGVRYEGVRDEDIMLARFLVKNKYLPEDQVKEQLAEQDPYYREGKEFTRLDQLLLDGALMTKERVDAVKKMMGGLASAVKQISRGAPGAAPPVVGVPDPKRSTIRAESLVLDHCKVNVRKHVVKTRTGNERKIYILSISGQLDAHSFSQFDDFLEGLLDKERHNLVVDMARLEYISSAGIGVLAGTVRKAREGNGDLRLSSVPDSVMKVLALVGFEKMMQIYPTDKEAIESYAE